MLSDHLEKLSHFVGVARAGSIRNYAVTRNLSQSAISKCVQNLEAELSAILFIRGRNGVELTQAGHELFEWSQEILSGAKEIEEKIKKHGNLKLNGELKMGTYQSIAVYFIPKFFKFIQKEQKKLQIQFVSASSAELVTLLKAGKVDFIVSIDPPQSGEFFQVVLFEDRYSLYKSANSSRKLKEDPIFTLPSAKDRSGKSIESYLKAAKVRPQMIACGDFEAAKAMLEVDAGFALLPERVALPWVETEKIEKVRNIYELNSIGAHSIVFSTKRHRASDASIKWIADQLHLMLRASR